MKFLKAVIAIFKSYEYSDKLISVLGIAVVLLMVVKMMIFPTGFFNFGKSDTYTEGLVSKNGIQNINPLFVDYNEADREISRVVFSGLMKYDPEKRVIIDDMASLSINADKTEYTFVLRDGIKWHDGQPLTVDDVYYTYHDVIMNNDFPNEILKVNFAGVEITKVDAKTIKFKLEKPNIFFVTNFIIGILPQHILKDVAPVDMLQNEFNKMPVGSGPYMLSSPVESFSDGRMQVTLSANPSYYGDPIKIKNLRFITYPTMEELVKEKNSVNGVVKITGSYIVDFKNDPRFTLIQYELPQYTAIFMNMESKILKDNKNVRLALQKAVDKNALIAQFIDKIPVDTPLMELNQEEEVYQPNIEQASGALKEAGYAYKEDDLKHDGPRYDKDGNTLTLNFIARAYDADSYQFEETKKIVMFLQSSWERVGFDIQVEFLPQEDFKARIMSRKYDLLLVGQSLGYNLDTYSYWHSTQAGPMGQNLSNYKSFGVDSLIEDIRSVFDQEKRTRELRQLAEQIKDDIPAIFLYRPIYYYATDGKVSGISMEGIVFPCDRFFRISTWDFQK